MRRLKLQMQMSLDGMVAARRRSEHSNWDEEVRQYSIENASNVDCLLIGRKIAPDFIRHWKSVSDNPKAPDHEFGALITNMPKIVFSKTTDKSEWANATVVNGDIVEEVNRLKGQVGKDLIVYGGHGFVSSLINHNLIDEFHFLLNPLAYGDGLSIFSGLRHSRRLKLARSREFSCGTVLLHYEAIPG